jgi:predicted alpha/beta hydrolase
MTLTAVGYLAKPRSPVREAALGLPHERVAFAATDGVRLSGWYVPGRNGAAVVVVHGGGGDREGAVRHARMLTRAGHGVLLYDARGRGRSAGNENVFGWRWHRDVRGAVDLLQRRGVRRTGLLGLSTGAEAVITEAADDPRVGAVVADGVQGRSAADASRLSLGNRIAVQPVVAVVGAEIAAVRGESPPAPLVDVVRGVARSRPLLLVATVPVEREWGRLCAGTSARLWELPHLEHTRGLADHPVAYARPCARSSIGRCSRRGAEGAGPPPTRLAGV